MRNILSSGVLLLVVMAFASCEEPKEAVTTIEGLVGEATITGTIYVDNIQTTGNADMELASNAVVRITYNSKDLSYSNSLATPNYPISIQTTTNTDGEFSVVVPTTNQGVTFTIEAEQYKTSIRRDGGSTEAFFGEQIELVTLKIGETTHVLLSYGSIPDFELI